VNALHSALRSKTCVICDAPLSLALDGRSERVCRRVECQWTYRSTPKHRACHVCGRPLETRQIPNRVCADSDCVRVHGDAIQREAVARSAARHAENAAAATKRRDEAAAEVGVGAPESYIPTSIPGLTKRITRLSRARRASLREHIAKLIEEARSSIVGDSPARTSATLFTNVTPDPTQGMVPGLAKVLGQACARCKGHCCSYGGNHAYLRVDAVKRYMTAHPEKSDDQILDDYLARLAERTYVNSCAYHGKLGCTLPRDMRSSICNSFYCYGLTQLRMAVEAGAEPRVFALITDPQSPIDGAFISADEVRVVRRSTPPTS
jgi:hypothetical protein